MTFDTMQARLGAVKERLAAAERAAGRPEGSVRLVCVSKMHPASAIREAYALGERRFGGRAAFSRRGQALGRVARVGCA